ncbi:hypothetical protein Tco_1032118 [Tanacetum coccineum]|uniref:Uncharacterized protein n=1 Tax=Tanacetum coccineum TaxID=301880 RepID=A0ABQ5GD97_9ASTR
MKENTSKSKNSDPILELWIRIEAYKKKLEHINVPWENILFNYCSSEFDTLEPERVKENRASEFQYKKLSKRAFEWTTSIKESLSTNLLHVKMDDPNINMEEYIRLEEEKARRRGKVYNLKTPTYVSPLNDNQIDFRISSGESDDEDYTIIYDKNSFSYKIIYVNNLKTDSKDDNDKVNMPSFPSSEPTVSYFDDFEYFKDFEKEFPTIAYNDALTSKLDFSEPTVSPQHIDEF